MDRKKRRRYMKINLFETSVVGIPAYPDAHFSLMKALSQSYSSDERRLINFKQVPMAEENQIHEVIKDEAVEVKSSEVKAIEVEKAKKEEPKEEVEEESDEEKSKKMLDLMTKALEQALKNTQVQRGFVEKESQKKSVKDLSDGELALLAFKRI